MVVCPYIKKATYSVAAPDQSSIPVWDGKLLAVCSQSPEHTAQLAVGADLIQKYAVPPETGGDQNWIKFIPQRNRIRVCLFFWSAPDFDNCGHTYLNELHQRGKRTRV